jgi:hypothetical protein
MTGERCEHGYDPIRYLGGTAEQTTGHHNPPIPQPGLTEGGTR